jgi:proline iminopeptidase
MAEVSSVATTLFDQEASSDRKAVMRANLQALTESSTDGQAMLAYTPMRFYDPHFNAAQLFAGSAMKPAFLQHLFGTLAPQWNAAVTLPLLRAPVWLAQGRYDYASPGAMWDDLLPSMLIATRQVFEKSGHQPFVEEPEEFSTALLEWMHA